MARILLTGAAGCVGSYLLEILSLTHEVFALTRSPQLVRQRFHSDNVHLLAGDLQVLLKEHRPLLETFEYCVHPATVWGGPSIFQVNVEQTLALFEALSPRRCRGVHYFSTASLLNAAHQLQTQAFTQGTDYIRSKACAHEKIYLFSKASGVPVHMYYPTVIFGGDAQHGSTPVTEFLPRLKKQLQWVKWLRVAAWFHWIHAADIARIVNYRIQQDLPADALVLGNPAYSVAQAQAELLAFYEEAPAPFQVNLESYLPMVLPLLAQRMSPWDRFSLHQRQLRYQVVNAQTYGLPSLATRLQDLL